MLLHSRKKVLQFVDARVERDWRSAKLECSGVFPRLPKPEDAPERLRQALRRDVENILAGHWKAFGHLDLQVDDPPKWQKDYLVGKDLATTQVAFKLDHRQLPHGADSKLIWELSRWYQPVRLAMAAYLLGDERASRKCVEWLEDWAKHNLPYRGWNWTSALEVGIRLIQFTWIDALLTSRRRQRGEVRISNPENHHGFVAPGATEERLSALRYAILPAHVGFAWRYKSFGSSANNHLMGELAGLILATVRWPALANWGAPLSELRRRWEDEVLAQFAEDGGNKEQALNYQLFSWEFCWQAQAALEGANEKVSSTVKQRLESAARFFWEVQARREPWDYGDSDNAFVTPLFTNEQTLIAEWRDWISQRGDSRSLEYWLGCSPFISPALGKGRPAHVASAEPWWIYRNSGIAICESGYWWLRWDLSPLGYLRTAAHGHLDALHVSIWRDGVAMVVDPGTGAYYADKQLRSWLASRAAHNAPCPLSADTPKRLGPFLWDNHHSQPEYAVAQQGITARLRLGHHLLERTLRLVKESDAWEVDDLCLPNNGDRARQPAGFSVRWQFPPGATVKARGSRNFIVRRNDIEIVIQVSADWSDVTLVETAADREKFEPENLLAGTVSPAFRKTIFAPYLLLKAEPRDGKARLYRTTFSAR
jgi:hypothetical protein